MAGRKKSVSLQFSDLSLSRQPGFDPLERWSRWSCSAGATPWFKLFTVGN